LGGGWWVSLRRQGVSRAPFGSAALERSNSSLSRVLLQTSLVWTHAPQPPHTMPAAKFHSSPSLLLLNLHCPLRNKDPSQPTPHPRDM
jgi:hypothetical protein